MKFLSLLMFISCLVGVQIQSFGVLQENSTQTSLHRTCCTKTYHGKHGNMATVRRCLFYADGENAEATSANKALAHGLACEDAYSAAKKACMITTNLVEPSGN